MKYVDLLLSSFLLLGLELISIAAQNDKKTQSTQDIQSELNYLPKEVIVIGAGLAGTAAARRISNDKTNFTVRLFEAQKERYGGRVWTDKLTNMKARGIEVDLGGSAFNTASKNNPLIELAEDFELEIASVENLQFLVPWEAKSYSGLQLAAITKEAAEILGKALNESRSYKMEASIKEAVDNVLKKEGSGVKDRGGAHLVKCLPSYILKDYSTKNYEADVLDVGYEKVLLDGMGELVDRLMSGSTEESPLHLYLNKVVRQIHVDDNRKKAVVRLQDGSQAFADMVVVAVPPTVIASGDLLFDPDLPKKYKLAASEISTSAGDKLVVEFDKPFWPPEFGVFVRAVQKEEERGHLQTWININKLINKPVLASFLQGENAVQFEKLNDEEAKQAVLEVLTEMFGEEAVKSGGEIKGLQRSKWSENPWSKGASTYPKVGTDPSLWNTFAEPLCPYIYFAGEHTSFENHGTLHGAYNSGIRAADQIMSGLCERILEEQRQKEKMRKKMEASKKKKKNVQNNSESSERKDGGNDDDDVDEDGERESEEVDEEIDMNKDEL